MEEEQNLRHQTDQYHFHNASKLKRLLFSLDKDFLDDHRFPLHRSPGVFVLIADQSDPNDIYWSIAGVAVFLEEAFSKVPDFVAKIKVCVSLEGQRIRFVSHESKVTEVVAPWFATRPLRK